MPKHVASRDNRNPRAPRQCCLGLGGRVFMVARDGTEMPVDQIATPMRDSQGQINGIVLVLRSVPDPNPKTRNGLWPKRSPCSMRSTQICWRWIWMGRCAFVSRSAAQLLGYQSHELIGRIFVRWRLQPKRTGPIRSWRRPTNSLRGPSWATS